jgi:hypothetical protein
MAGYRDSFTFFYQGDDGLVPLTNCKMVGQHTEKMTIVSSQINQSFIPENV